MGSGNGLVPTKRKAFARIYDEHVQWHLHSSLGPKCINFFLISLQFALKSPIKTAPWVQVMAWYRQNEMLLPESMTSMYSDTYIRHSAPVC